MFPWKNVHKQESHALMIQHNEISGLSMVRLVHTLHKGESSLGVYTCGIGGTVVSTQDLAVCVQDD